MKSSNKTSCLNVILFKALLKRYADSVQDRFTHGMVAGVCSRLFQKEKTDVTLLPPSLFEPIYISKWLLFTKWPATMTDIFCKHQPACQMITRMGGWGVKISDAQSICCYTNVALQSTFNKYFQQMYSDADWYIAAAYINNIMLIAAQARLGLAH